MNDMKKCRLCLKIVYENEFDIIGKITKQMLNGLLLTLDLDEGDGAVMCDDCDRKLQNALDFKTLCLDAENKTLLYINSGEGIKEEKEESVVKFMDDFKDQEICRFCKKPAESGGFVSLQEKKETVFMVDIILKHIPELHLNLTEELSTCETCLGSLQCLVSFITACLEANEKIKNDIGGNGFIEIGSSTTNIIKVEEKYIAVKHEIKCEECMEIDNPEITIKSGESEIKSEQNDCERFQSTSMSQLGYTDEHSLPHNLDKPTQVEEDIPDIIYQCQMCSYKTKYEFYFKKHSVIHEKFSEEKLQKCDKCSYKTRLAGNLKKHTLIHQSPLEVQMYSCDLCHFETKRKGTLTKHMQVHRDVSELPVYKCETCSYESRHKHSLKRHVLIHQDPSQLTVYKCESCHYKTIHKSQLNVHKMTHMSPVEMFSCNMCSYETKQQKYLKTHLLKHKRQSKITLFKCGQCVFETKHKNSLKKHQLTHQDESEVTMFKCYKCTFQTKHKSSMIGHCMTHQGPFKNNSVQV